VEPEREQGPASRLAELKRVQTPKQQPERAPRLAKPQRGQASKASQPPERAPAPQV
jgi:hypothetical protein